MKLNKAQEKRIRKKINKATSSYGLAKDVDLVDWILEIIAQELARALRKERTRSGKVMDLGNELGKKNLKIALALQKKETIEVIEKEIEKLKPIYMTTDPSEDDGFFIDSKELNKKIKTLK